MQNQIRVEIAQQSEDTYVATIFDKTDAPRLTIRLGEAVHLWHIDLVLGAYRLYWEAEGIRGVHLNKAEGVLYNDNIRYEDQANCKKEVAKGIIDLVCRTNDPKQPNILKKLNENRYVYICSTEDRNSDVYIAGGLEKPYFFVRRRGTGEVIGRFGDLKAAKKAK